MHYMWIDTLPSFLTSASAISITMSFVIFLHTLHCCDVCLQTTLMDILRLLPIYFLPLPCSQLQLALVSSPPPISLSAEARSIVCTVECGPPASATANKWRELGLLTAAAAADEMSVAVVAAPLL
ncbi:hypothetical protein BCR44DRAFT_1442176 [Catenaria anguillulae PL171]|uniref:Uncharacterized protein n=1 Tax=Catenaria anguillulae PL171 TaxID=765915 RepID=A0A1Y2HA94_9FUNG|nr:hypothetical protein BCR44DRAFT_1442176 [Catenaria anguillulae PL171]